ncbi:hypothetical protein PFDSM3638_01430 [Pyrococcus furiosus DSM 3638]|uniref:Uncharacterized protein n=2 Tax=Pyrococcus furiosus TaxID=2261 RepID=A0A5C0XLZ2_PYRFU|nr:MULTISPECIES: hypothetical protein [Pyrococcus]AFN03087.1 hypothetical protein PFC_00565 [Pyrococcus furiosus COM1]MDK2870125.1 hypothetical protein [Pyrococcus sp.]QEK78016.1 hypothetical protein PFDSM3638_01430 [Pyrococcus furiosus DSM 3638]
MKALIVSLFRFLLYVPRVLFYIAGIIRHYNRGKRAFKKALKEEALPPDVVEILSREVEINLGWIFKLFRHIPNHEEFNTIYDEGSD